MLRPERMREFRRLLGERMLVLDGAMGTVIQSYQLGESRLSRRALSRLRRGTSRATTTCWC